MSTPQQTKFKILLVGDNGIDQYEYGNVDRISPEAPVPIINYTHSDSKPGMAANVKDNLIKLGCDVDFIHGIKTSIKTRVIDNKSKQHLLRIDQDQISNPVTIDLTTLQEYNAIVVSDYNKGSVAYETIEQLRANYAGPIFVDTKKTDLKRFEGCFIKINELEHSRVTSLPEGVPSGLIVTLGRNGVQYNEHKIAAPQVEAFDVCGAGDTFLSALVYNYITTASMLNAIDFAVKAASITIQHIGVYSPTLLEITKAYD